MEKNRSSKGVVKTDVKKVNTNGESFAKECLQIHNKYRLQHGCPPLQISKQLMDYAVTRTQTSFVTTIPIAYQKLLVHSDLHNTEDADFHLAKENKLVIKINPNQPYGENIFVLQGSIDVTAEQVVKTWYNEINKYNFEDGKFILEAGHFTQLIWKSCKNFGINMLRKEDVTWAVAVYEPPGNYEGQFKENVPTRKTLTAEEEVAGPSNESAIFAQQCLESHNKLRKLHGCPPLKLNEKISLYATEWVKSVAAKNQLQHREDCLYGECMFMAQGNLIVTGEQVVKAWYAEIAKYNFKEAKFTPITGHFTQVIWKSTTDLGVGYLRNGITTWVVCNYDPAGNYPGEFVENVPQVGSKPTPLVNRSPAAEDAMPFETQMLIAHNKYRKLHGSPPLKLKQNLSDFSLDWAQNLSARNIMEHRPDNKYGENIYLAQGVPHVTGERVVKAWYDEITKYDFNLGKFSHETGHFTQLVWVATKEFGVGKVKKAGTTWVVCNYDPPGNYQGEFKLNVPKVGSPPYVDPNANIPFDHQCLIAHNKYRALHGCPPLKLNKKLSDFAAEWAQVLSERNQMQHRPDNEYGENIFMGIGNIVFTGERVVKAWYDEIKLYDFRAAKFSHAAGHFTQLIWKDCKEVGVSIIKKENTTIVVANYNPPGNYRGEFAVNVPPLVKK